MRQGSNSRRLRGRSNGRKNSNPRSQNFESNGPEVKVRGSAQQVVEKYLALARDASSAGDRIAAESYFQHAEHYYRVMNANNNAYDQRDNQSQPPVNHGPPQSQPVFDVPQDAAPAETQPIGAERPAVEEEVSVKEKPSQLASDGDGNEPASA